MQASTVLSFIGVVQALFCVLLVGVLVVHQRRTSRHLRARQQFASQLEEPLRAWALGERTFESLLPELRAVPPTIALESISVHCAVRATPVERARMAASLRGEAWVQRVLDQHRSGKWTPRMQAARMLVVAGGPEDRPILETLLSDPHAAVVSAALSAVPFLADESMVHSLLASLPQRADFLRARTVEELRKTTGMVLGPLRYCLQSEHTAAELVIYLGVADQLADPRTIVACATHATHRDASVRQAVARAMQHYFSARAHGVLLALLQDAAPEVRAEAARTLGEIRAVTCVPALSLALRDSAHGVRLAAALALANIGAPGATALASAATSDDRFAADAARFVASLSRGAIRELAEV
ncbi:MAG: HEAT repeat domain-containing protein [Gemmatimonadaceae bacterium]|nr:HEAT repeat domain-containing protein [Gemmatimonadaceae bacterium]